MILELYFSSCVISCIMRSFYSSPNKIRVIKSRRMRCAGYISRMGEKRNAYRILVGKPEGKRPLERQRRRWVDNIKIDLRQKGWDAKNPLNRRLHDCVLVDALLLVQY
jgi:hypothetical protein